MAKLYELQATFNQVIDLIDDPDANLEVLESVLQEIEGEFDQKIEGCVMMVKNMEAETVGIKAEVDRLSARKKALDNRIDGLKNYMLMQMTLLAKDKIKTPNGLFTVTRQKSPASVVVHNANDIPDKFFVIIPEQRQIDKLNIKDALAGGEEVPGCGLQQGYHLRIR